MHWSRYCLLAVFAGGTALALQNPRPVDDREWSPAHTKETAASIQDPELKGSWDDLVAGTGDGCKTVGANSEFFDRINHYRGNSYRVTREVNLTEIKMLLGMNVSTDLYVSIHRRATGTIGQWARYPAATGWTIQNPAATGTTNPQFYSTGAIDPPVLLEDGYDYAIGFSWTSSVRYFKDLFQSYPGATPPDFDFGQVMGLVGLNPVTPPMNDNLTISVSSNGAYAMSLCLSGACCLPSGNCEDLSQFSCQEGSGQFTAAGITCDDLEANDDRCPLHRGACCYSDTCSFVNEYACGGVEGEWTDQVFCNDPIEEPCEPSGGCCLPSGGCVNDQTVRSCQEVHAGVFRGEGITCSASPPCTAGACCFGLTCGFELTSTDCIKAGGVFKGPGTSCTNNPCIPRGACCNATTGACEDNVSQPTCTNSGRTFRGDGTTCAALSPVCGRGACCINTVGCQDANGAGLTRSFCEQTLGGTFRGDGTTCSTINPRCPGRCCWFNNTTCTSTVAPEQCTADLLDGIFLPYSQTCSPFPCAGVTPTGCCLPSGSCVNVSTATVCTSQLLGTVRQNPCGSGPACEPVVPRGSCCDRSTFVCQDNVKQADCTAFSQQWTQNVLCANLLNPCEPRGACCDRDTLTCTENLLDRNCPAESEWTARKFCDQLDPLCAEVGACCLGEANCQIKTDDQCFALGGTYKGDDSSCQTPDLCVIRGACCDGEECIPNATVAECAAVEGAFQGEGSTCEAGVTCIPTGVCCTGQACDDTETQESCQGIYRGDGTTCSPVNPCIPVGACCNGLGNCSTSSEATCTGDGGAYAGDGSQCADSCERGACCATTDDGCGCLGDQFEYECRDQGGLFFLETDCEVVGKCPVEIVSADPRDCALDARQSPPGGGPAGEIDSILVKFSCDATGMTADDLEIVQAPPQGTPLTIADIMVDGTEVHVMFDGPIPFQVWTCVRHIDSDTQTCVGYLPGDVNNNEISNLEDVSALIAEMDAMHAAIPQLSLTSIQCDMDRSGACAPQDILRALDLISGVSDKQVPVFASWNNAVPAAPCPNAAPLP